MQIKPTTIEDVEQICAWSKIDIDESHRKTNPEFWLTAAPGSYFGGAIEDADGIVLYFRFDREQESLLRMHTQFAPSTKVNRSRVAKAISAVLPSYLQIVQADGIDGIVFETRFPELVAFMARLGFIKAEGKHDDYILEFAVTDELAKQISNGDRNG
jgi:hypothetical protein